MKIDKSSVLKCPVFIASQILGKRWTLLLLQMLMMPSAKNGLRFSQLQRLLPWISPKILTERLRELETEKILVRIVDTSRTPPSVSYRLTEKGLDLRPTLIAMQEWGIKHGGNIVANCPGGGFDTCETCTSRTGFLPS
ncbi:MAG: helix-turn-helix transcriptional regulator [Candidatus Thorarchaeota archaeon]|nr:helix-turn-helix transcriptional regulator [Candidatus Thorarchaeota archaeon]